MLTGILEFHVIAVDGVFYSARHDFELHDLLSYGHVWFGDVNLHFRVVNLVGQTISHYIWEIPNTYNIVSFLCSISSEFPIAFKIYKVALFMRIYLSMAIPFQHLFSSPLFASRSTHSLLGKLIQYCIMFLILREISDNWRKQSELNLGLFRSKVVFYTF